MSQFKVRVLKGRYRNENITDMEFPLVKQWQDGKNGGFVTIPAVYLGGAGKNIRLSCSLEDVVYLDHDNNVVELPALEASLPNGQPAPSTMKMMTTGVKHTPLSSAVSSATRTPEPVLAPVSTHVPITYNQTPEEKYLADETDEEAMDRIADTFSMLNEITESTASGVIRGLVVSGPPGVGKSHGVIKTLNDMPNTVKCFNNIKGRDEYLDFNVEIVKGKSSALHLYMALYNNRFKGNVLVFDDCDSIMYDEDALNLLKAALDTSDVRHLSWRTESKVLNDEGIDRDFEFEGSVIFLTNLDFENTRGKIGEHMKAIMSRCHYLDLEIGSRRDQILRIKQVVRDGMLTRYGFSTQVQNEIMDYVYDNVDFLRELSLRMVIKIAEMVQANPYNWKRSVESTCLVREARLKRLHNERIKRKESQMH